MIAVMVPSELRSDGPGRSTRRLARAVGGSHRRRARLNCARPWRSPVGVSSRAGPVHRVGSATAGASAATGGASSSATAWSATGSAANRLGSPVRRASPGAYHGDGGGAERWLPRRRQRRTVAMGRPRIRAMAAGTKPSLGQATELARGTARSLTVGLTPPRRSGLGRVGLGGAREAGTKAILDVAGEGFGQFEDVQDGCARQAARDEPSRPTDEGFLGAMARGRNRNRRLTLASQPAARRAGWHYSWNPSTAESRAGISASL